ncbi:MAG: mechanosensitive ion channel, partial [Bacteroidales bacterium]|nr:mechanosensitive ion channel [Bacteroidales bacterium]
MEETLKSTLTNLIPQAISYCKMLIVAVILLFVGFWLIKKLIRGLKSVMTKRNLDPTLTSFSLSVINIALKVLLLISVISYVGIPMTSFVAILGAASLAVGMALQGTLQNFAGGVMLLLFRPFKVGDFVELGGFSGTVKEIQIFNTFLTTGDNKVVLIPNGGISTSSMTNYSRMPERRVD